MKSSWSYLIYIIFWELLILGGCGYAVFVIGASGWWFVLAFALSQNAYSPGAWSKLESKGVA